MNLISKIGLAVCLPMLTLNLGSSQKTVPSEDLVAKVDHFFQDIFADLRLTSESEVDVVQPDGTVQRQKIGALFGMTRVVTAFNYHPGLNPHSFAEHVPAMDQYRSRLDRLQSEAKQSSSSIAISAMGCGGKNLDAKTITQRWANLIGDKSKDIPDEFYRVGTFERVPKDVQNKAKRHADLYKQILNRYFTRGETQYSTDINKIRYFVSAVKLSDAKCLSCHTGSKKGDVVALMVYCVQHSGR